MPNAIGTDFRAIEKMVQERTGIFTMGFRTDGIHSYLPGAGNAYVRLAQHILKRPVKQPQRPARRVNILGLTPLDFSVVGNATTLKRLITDAGFILQSSWSMGDTLDHLAEAADADVNAVVSSTGFYLAQYMRNSTGFPM
jgi:nitrogenase molybdenum-iron protein alpha/beta subunit